MSFELLADLVLLAHAAFVVFVVCGGLLALVWPRAAWVHLPAALWGVLVELLGWVCPLTPLENWLRCRAGESGYEGDFLARYVLPLLYPEGLTRRTQLVLGLIVLTVNAAIYCVVFRRRTGRGI